MCDANGTLVGIISERDLLKECSQNFKNISKTRIKEKMTKEVIIGILEDDLGYIADVMTRSRIRHLPILDGNKLAGIISIRDVVDVQLEESKATVRFLNDYIAGGANFVTS